MFRPASSWTRPWPTVRLRFNGSIGNATLHTGTRTTRQHTSRGPFFSSNGTKMDAPVGLLLRRSFADGSFRSRRQSLQLATNLIIGANAAVFLAWQYADYNKDRKLMQVLHEHFALSTHNWRNGHYWTVITSAFSHQNLMHFAFNMLTLRAFTSVLAWVPGFGATHFLTLGLGSAAAGSLAWLSEQGQTSGDRRWGSTATSVYKAALGASGLVMGVGAGAACLMPFAPMNFMFIPVAIPLWATTALFAAVDTYFLHSERSPIGHSAHLGGTVFGLLYYGAYLRKFGGITRWLKQRRGGY